MEKKKTESDSDSDDEDIRQYKVSASILSYLKCLWSSRVKPSSAILGDHEGVGYEVQFSDGPAVAAAEKRHLSTLMPMQSR